MVGVAIKREPILIVLEYLPGGTLLSWLSKCKTEHKKVSEKQMLKFTWDAASGMEYLHSKECIHRDLAARNCLLSGEGENELHVKVADFGLSRSGPQYEIETCKEIPVRWTALECLKNGIYTLASDVWSYGILLWEIFSMGETPYVGMSNQDAAEFLNVGHRLPIPPKTPEELGELMQSCWVEDARKRPTFTEIIEYLRINLNLKD